jgi:hypothetical protein
MDQKLREELAAVVRSYRDRVEVANQARESKQRELDELTRQLATTLSTAVRPVLEEIARELGGDGFRPQVKEVDSLACGADRGRSVLLHFSTRARAEEIVIIGSIEHRHLSAYRRGPGNPEGPEKFASWKLDEFSMPDFEREVVKKVTSIIEVVQPL